MPYPGNEPDVLNSSLPKLRHHRVGGRLEALVTLWSFVGGGRGKEGEIAGKKRRNLKYTGETKTKYKSVNSTIKNYFVKFLKKI